MKKHPTDSNIFNTSVCVCVCVYSIYCIDQGCPNSVLEGRPCILQSLAPTLIKHTWSS